MSSAPIIDVVTGNLQTTSSSILTVVTFPTTTGATHQVWVQIAAISTGSTEGGGWILTETIKNVGDSVTTISSDTLVEHRDDVKWAALIATSGTDIIVQVQGDSADTIDWVIYTEIATSLA